MKLPEFLIIGTPRGGTSTLFHMLCQIPGLWGQPIKELHYFNQHFEKGVAWYGEQFKQAPKDAVIFEATPFYLASPDVPSRVKDLLPDINLVVLLREPVTRCVSHYWWNQDKFGSDPEVLIDSSHHCVKQGYYAKHLERWFEFFERDRFLIIASEDFFDKPIPLTRLVAMRTGISHEVAHKTIFEKTYYDPLAWRKAKYGSPMVSKEVRRWLRLHYKSHNKRLAKLLSSSLITEHWKDME